MVLKTLSTNRHALQGQLKFIDLSQLFSVKIATKVVTFLLIINVFRSFLTSVAAFCNQKATNACQCFTNFTTAFPAFTKYTPAGKPLTSIRSPGPTTVLTITLPVAETTSAATVPSTPVMLTDSVAGFGVTLILEL